MISDEKGMGKVLGGDGSGTTLSSAVRSFYACSALHNSSFTLSTSSFLLCDAAKSASILSCSILEAATLSCSVRIISRPAPSSQLLLQLMARLKFALSFSFFQQRISRTNEVWQQSVDGITNSHGLHGQHQMISQGIRTSKDSPHQTLSSARMLQALHKNSKQTYETPQTAPLAADCTPTLKSASQNYQRTKN